MNTVRNSEAIKNLSLELIERHGLVIEHELEGDIIFNKEDNLFIQELVNGKFILSTVHMNPANPKSIEDTVDGIIELFESRQKNIDLPIENPPSEWLHYLVFSKLEEAVEKMIEYSHKPSHIPRIYVGKSSAGI